MDELAPGRRRLQTRLSRLAGEEVLVAVPVMIRGTVMVLPVSMLLALVLVGLVTGRPGPLVAVAPLGYLLVWVYSKVMAARQSSPVRLGLAGVLAVTPSAVLVASVNWWTGRPNRVRATWPRSGVTIEIGAHHRLIARSVTVRHDIGTSTAFESLLNRAWIGPALGELQAVALTGVLPPTVPSQAGWLADPWNSPA